jgi:hypothetical protein
MRKLYLLTVTFFIGFVGNSQISYPSSQICASSPNVYPQFAPNTIAGGVFSSSPGLLINTSTGEIDIPTSAPGIYIVTYTVSPAPPDFISQSFTYEIQIIPFVVPLFNEIYPICYGSVPATLPTVSTNGILGTWSPSTIDNTVTSTYTFSPNFMECATMRSMTIIVLPSVATPAITTASGSNTVYVDESNNIVAPLTLLCSETSAGFSYEWFVDGLSLPIGTSETYTVNTPSSDGAIRVYNVKVTNNESNCFNSSQEFVVYQSSGTPPPVAPRIQSLASGSTLANIVITGTDIQWYASATNKNVTATALPMSTLLVDGMTYYATQTVNGNESLERLPVTVNLTLDVEDNELVSLIYWPNPVKNSLNVKTKQDLKLNSLSIYNTLGQLVQVIKNPNETIDVSELKSGIFFIKILSDKGSVTGKFIKE